MKKTTLPFILGGLVLAGAAWLALPAPSVVHAPAAKNPAAEAPLPVAHAITVKAPAPLPDLGGFTQEKAGRFSAKQGHLEVELSAGDGVTVRNTNAQGSLRLALASAARGASTLYDAKRDAAGQALPLPGDHGGIRFHRAEGLEETNRLLDDGAEQTLRLTKAPAGEGDLVVSLAMETKGITPVQRAFGAGGVRFTDRDGNFAVKVGQVIAKDAAGQATVIEPQIWRASGTIRYEVPASFLAKAAYPVAVTRATVISTSEFSFTEDDVFTPTAPSIAANNPGTPANTRWAVAWVDFTFGAPILLIRTANSTGGLSDPEQITIPQLGEAPLGITPMRPQVASDGDGFVVIWSENNGGIFASFLDSTGALVLDGDSKQVIVQVAPTTAKLSNELPIIAYNGEQYIVGWHDVNSKVTRIHYAFLATDGSTISGAKLLGPATSVARNQALVSITPGPNNETLFIYADSGESPLRYRAARVDKDGNLLDPVGVALFNDAEKDFGFGFPIGCAPAGPAITPSGTLSGWQILSTNDQTTDSRIFRHFLEVDDVDVNGDAIPEEVAIVTRADQAPGGPVFAEMGVGPIGLSSVDRFSVAWAGDALDNPNGPGEGEWLFVRNWKISNVEHHLLARRVGFDGTVFDETPVQADTSNSVTIKRNAVAAAGIGANKFMVCWTDGGNLSNGIGKDLNAAVLDTVVAGDNSAFLKADLQPVSFSNPVVIPQNTTVTFDWSGSKPTGLSPTITQRISFGDGGAPKTIAFGTTQADHLYKAVGTFFARIELNSAGFKSFATVKVIVGGGTGVEGAETVVGGGSPITPSANVNSNLILTEVRWFFDFASLLGKKDTLLVRGLLNRSFLPETDAGETIAGKTCTITFNGPENNPGLNADGYDAASTNTASFTFLLDNTGAFHSANNADVDAVDFTINKAKGTFEFAISLGQLHDTGTEYIVPDSVASHTASQRQFQFGMDINGKDFGQSTVLAIYDSNPSTTGKGVYLLNGTGKERTGSLQVTSFKASEATLKPSGIMHTVTIKGILAKPNGTAEPDGNFFTLPSAPTTETFSFRVGEFDTADVDIAACLADPVTNGKLKQSTTSISYAAPKTLLNNIKQFKINRKTGAFQLKLNKIIQLDAGGADVGGIGLPLKGLIAGNEDLEILADIYIAMQLDLEDKDAAPEDVDADTFCRIFRKNAKQKSWKNQTK